ncbi:MAG: cobalt-precorrin-5B (C(1))-methyltransferase [Bacteroidota bacterium]
MSLREVPKGPLREGFTTGACATAAAKAALTAIVKKEKQEQVAIHLPVGKKASFQLHTCEYTSRWARCSVIKDAGDDPDVTNGAEIGCEVELIPEKKVIFHRGKGVGVVTLPGLELEVGEPAINPVPRQMIRNAIRKVVHDYDLDCGAAVKVFVTDGERIAKRTLNERVGIFEGISILGTTGIVKPYSAASYIASIVQGIDVAVANGVNELVLNSGGRSEKFLRSLFSGHSEQAFIHYGNWIGESLKKIETAPIDKVHLGIMLGKAVKLAEGKTDTHSCVSSWNKDFVRQLALDAGCDEARSERITSLNMAGRLVELFDFHEKEPLYQKILEHCFQACRIELKTAQLDLYLVGKNGEIIPYII